MTTTTSAPSLVPSPGGPGRASSPWMTHARKFVARIQRICAEDPGARAALRSGVGKPLDEVPRMHRIVAPCLPPDAYDEDTQRAYYTVASLIAAQKTEVLRAEHNTPAGGTGDTQETVPAAAEPPPYGTSLGQTFAMAVAAEGRDGLRESAAEMRLNLLTRQSTTGLHRHLPAAVRQLCDHNTPPDWAQLLVHLRAWPRDRKRISRRWLQDYYRSRREAELEAARKAADALPDPQNGNQP